MPLRNFFKSFGTRESKCLPSWVCSLPPEKQRFVLAGYLLGDGCFARPGVSSNTISVNAAFQLYEMFMRNDIPCSIRPVKGQNNNHPQWIIAAGTPVKHKIISWIPPHLLAAKNCQLPAVRQDQTQLRFVQNRLVGKVKRVTHKQHNNLVYNLEVEEDHSYVANGTVVHNCVISLSLCNKALSFTSSYFGFL
jgi:hypothetical protein